jgi:hypothetical protein
VKADKSTKTIRARRRQPERDRRPTAAKGRKPRVTPVVSRERRPVFEQWATMSPPDVGQSRPHVCLWGDQASAVEGCDPDEDVCLVRVEVLEVLDE